jgi:hypothetical protein
MHSRIPRQGLSKGANMSIRDRFKSFLGHAAVRRSVWMAGAGLFLAMLSVTPARAQFDDPAIIAGLIALNSMMQSSLGVPLAAIQATQTSMSDFEQNTVYPQGQLQQSQQLAGTNQQQTNSDSQTVQVQRLSGQNPVNIQFESALLSGDPNQLSSISGYYLATYGSAPTTNMPAVLKTTIDMNDALAQDAMKRAIQLDAMAKTEFAVVQTLLNEATDTSFGNAPMLQVQADAWLVQAHAYTQLGEADLLRLKAAQVATQGAIQKAGVSTQNSGSSAFSNSMSMH